MPKITVNVNRSHVELGHDEQGRMNEIIMRLTLLAPELTQTQRPRMPLNIGLVIDRSGSMSGQKLADAVAACQRIVSRLISEDRCTIVTFDDEVSLLADGNYVTPAQRTLISTALGVVRSGGSTNLSGGWQLAADTLLTHHARNGYVSRAVLLTEGRPMPVSPAKPSSAPLQATTTVGASAPVPTGSGVATTKTCSRVLRHKGVAIINSSSNQSTLIAISVTNCKSCLRCRCAT